MRKINLENIRITTDEKEFVIKHINSHKRKNKYGIIDHDSHINKLIIIEQSVNEFFYDLTRYASKNLNIDRYNITKTDVVNYWIYLIRPLVKKRISHINIYYYTDSIRIEIH